MTVLDARAASRAADQARKEGWQVLVLRGGPTCSLVELIRSLPDWLVLDPPAYGTSWDAFRDSLHEALLNLEVPCLVLWYDEHPCSGPLGDRDAEVFHELLEELEEEAGDFGIQILRVQAPRLRAAGLSSTVDQA